MKIYKYSLLLVSFLLFFSCDKETEGLSRITEYATFEMEGDDFMYVLVNSTFTEPGVSAFEGETELQIETRGSVNTAVPEVYVLQYSAKNSDGFAASVQRIVAVVPTIPTEDLSGQYQLVHDTRTNKINISKNEGVVGYYHASDSWFQSLAIPLDFVDMGDGTIKVLSGSSPYGAHYGTGTISSDGQINFTVTLTNQGPLIYSTSYFKL